ncbi:hypothetical protein VKT23_006485 [Stygiomarasmius scandens]|uniref:Uncharacterized protein n=1 Tax=Marasmiellus scandens TaxID=2682957 RepID=A0ABR1JPA7_9AGAR
MFNNSSHHNIDHSVLNNVGGNVYNTYNISIVGPATIRCCPDCFQRMVHADVDSPQPDSERVSLREARATPPRPTKRKRPRRRVGNFADANNNACVWGSRSATFRKCLEAGGLALFF